MLQVRTRNSGTPLPRPVRLPVVRGLRVSSLQQRSTASHSSRQAAADSIANDDLQLQLEKKYSGQLLPATSLRMPSP